MLLSRAVIRGVQNRFLMSLAVAAFMFTSVFALTAVAQESYRGWRLMEDFSGVRPSRKQ